MVDDAVKKFMEKLPQKYRTETGQAKKQKEDPTANTKPIPVGNWAETLPPGEQLLAARSDLRKLDKKMNYHAAVAIKKQETLEKELDYLTRACDSMWAQEAELQESMRQLKHLLKYMEVVVVELAADLTKIKTDVDALAAERK